MINAATFADRILKIDAVQRANRWLDTMPRPAVAIEISWDRISAVRWSRNGSMKGFASEPLKQGMIVPSAVSTNILDSAGVRSVMSRVCSRIQTTDEHAAVLLPDPVIRIFVQHFDQFPRSPQEAIPLLQWKLKKSVPFEISDTVLSYVRQESREGGFDVLTTIARLRVIREYEELVESVGLNAGVVSSSSLASLALIENDGPTLAARVSDRTVVTAIIRAGSLYGSRCAELPSRCAELAPQALLDEIYPFAACYHDACQERIQSVYIFGVGRRFSEFAAPIERELQCKVLPLLPKYPPDNRVTQEGRQLAAAGLDGLSGWMLSRE